MVGSMKLAEVLGLGIRLALTAWVAAVAVWDWRRAIIPNRLTLPVVAAVAATKRPKPPSRSGSAR